MKAFSSSVVIFVQELYRTSPITCLAYLLLSSTIFCCRSAVKNNPNTSKGVSGIGTVGPTWEVNGLMVTGESCSDHEVGSGAAIDKEKQ